MASTSTGPSGGSPSPKNDFMEIAQRVADKEKPFRKTIEALLRLRDDLRLAGLPIRLELTAGADTAAKDVAPIRLRDLQPDSDADEIVGSVASGRGGNIYRTAVLVNFEDALSTKICDEQVVWGRDEYVGRYAKFWLLADYQANGAASVRFTVRAYLGIDDDYGMSNRTNHLSTRFAGLARHTWWSLHDLPLMGEEGFRQTTYTSNDGTVPDKLVDDFLRLYEAGVGKGLLIKSAAPKQAPRYDLGGGAGG